MNRNMTYLFGAAAFVALAPGVARAQPANDFCNSPATISGTGSFFFTTILATTDGPSLPGCAAGTAFNDVWFCWTAPATGRFVFSTCGSTSLDTVLAIYPLCGCPALSQAPLVCNDDSCGTQSRAELDTTNGAQYFVRIGTYAESQSGSGNLTVATISGGSTGDACLTAFAAVLNTPNGFSLGSATSEVPANLPITCGDGRIYNDVWYSMTPDRAGPYRVTTCGQSAVDTVMAVYQGPVCPSGGDQPLTCSDDACGSQSSLVFSGYPDRPYFIRLGGYDASSRGSGTFTMTSAILAGPIIDPVTTHQYYLLGSMSWAEANAAAIVMGGTLVAVNSVAENDFVRTSVLRAGGIDRLGWLGLSDAASAGAFTWTSGEPLIFTAWAASQPRVSGTENYGVIDSRSGRWSTRVNQPAFDQIYGVVEIGGPVIAICRADIAGAGGPPGDGVVDGSDFIAFINSFAIGDPSIDPAADVSGPGGSPVPDGIIDGDDFIAFLNAFSAGC